MSNLIQIEPKAPAHHLYDSMYKTFLVFFASVSREPITFRGTTVAPKPLVVSPNVFRGFTCPPGCGACCGKATLDYIAGEPRPTDAVPRAIELNGKSFTLWSDPQADHNNYFCKHLTKDARCGIYEFRPFSCDFALLNVNEYKDHWLLSCRKFGRHHLWKKLDGTRGTMCEMLQPTDEWVANTRRRLHRLQTWVDHFGILSWMPEVNRWAAGNPYSLKELRLGW